MNKRQKKKKEKKYLPIRVDEFNLTTMTYKEREKAYRDFMKFRERYAFCKTYKELKEKLNECNILSYHFSVGEKFSNNMKSFYDMTKTTREQNFHTQKAIDFGRLTQDINIIKEDFIEHVK
ncbi:hypothetical protein [Bacillus subtilis]|uniref:hypothetical protein n=1 Tax=Bacillus subtilis TaxID=1423 RepID=UPI001B933808|nr:hypothetical protein [Bacillus subtilis]CAI6330837.1 hypothetical protein NRS6096_22110 [Bacillus subtilis]